MAQVAQGELAGPGVGVRVGSTVVVWVAVACGVALGVEAAAVGMGVEAAVAGTPVGVVPVGAFARMYMKSSGQAPHSCTHSMSSGGTHAASWHHAR